MKLLQAASQQKRIVVVLGMHRSGTSLLTRGLETLGVSLGDRLMPAAKDNPKGFWEDLDINALNVALLEALGHNWDTLTPVVPEDLRAPAVSEFKLRAAEVVRSKLVGTSCYGLKDPRVARLLCFWDDVFAHLKLHVTYVIACRNPLSVARSLAERNGFDREKSYYLWLEHMLASLLWSVRRDRIVVDYDLLIADPAGQLRRLAAGLGLPFDPEAPHFVEFRTNFLEDTLRHNHHQLEDFSLDRALPPGVDELYKALFQLAGDTLSFDSPDLESLLERLSAQQKQLYPALRYMRSNEERAAKAAQEAAALAETLTLRDRQIADLRLTVSTLQAGVQRLNNENSSLASQLAIIYGSGSWKIARLLHKLSAPLRRHISAAPHKPIQQD